MPDYLLPCTCGHKTAVSAVQAGETIRCVCGAELQVPSLRGLRDLEPSEAAEAGRRTPRQWEDRHRAAFLLVVAALVCLAVAAYLWATLPQGSTPPKPPDDAAEIKTVVDAFRMYVQMGAGLEPPPVVETPADKTRSLMLWGMGIAAVLAACALAGAILVLATRSPRRK